MANPCTEHSERVTRLETQFGTIDKKLDTLISRQDALEKRNSIANWVYGAAIALSTFLGTMAGAMKIKDFFPFIILFGLIALPLGCKQPESNITGDAQVSVVEGQRGVSGAEANVNAADRAVVLAKPYTKDAGKELLNVAQEDHQAALGNLQEVKDSLDATSEKLNDIQDKYDAQVIEYDRLYNKWYCKAGRWITDMLWVIGIAYIGLGVVGIFLPVVFSGGWALTLSKTIIRFLPIMNWVSPVRDWLINRKEGTVDTQTMPATNVTVTVNK